VRGPLTRATILSPYLQGIYWGISTTAGVLGFRKTKYPELFKGFRIVACTKSLVFNTNDKFLNNLYS